MVKNIKIISLIITLTISSIIGYASIHFLGEYGWTVFVLIPLCIGFFPPFITSKTKEISRNNAYKLSFLTLGIACFSLLVFAIEGLICIAMASPLLILLTLLGSYLGYLSQGKKIANQSTITILLVCTTIGLMSFDKANHPNRLIPVTTSIIVDSEVEKVWENVITFNQIAEATDWIFTTGISYPTDAIIEGKGVGAIRYCNFTTGSFVEPITTWDEPHLLKFDVIEQPIPMNELNPFWEVHPPHLDGYFKSYKGEFRLSKINDTATKLEGTTWYQIDITPEFYWKKWSNFIIHRIHQRVLNHIKKESEKK